MKLLALEDLEERRYQNYSNGLKVYYESIDDLITDSGAQRNGHRRKLLKWLIEQGKQAKCDQIHLDSAFQGEKRSLKQGGPLSESLLKKGKS